MENEALTLAIDTSFDETSVSVLRGLTVLSNVLPSQMEFHAKYGGTVPSLAKLAHIERIDNVVSEALKRAKTKIEDLDFIAVTYGPGLSIALEVGIKKAKELAEEFHKPLIAMNHMIGHLYSSFAERKSQKKIKSSLGIIKFPVIAFLISGGHTELILVEKIGKYKKIGETLDDSCGEAFDKCGRMLGLGFPAGPIVSDFAKKHRKNMSLKVVKFNQSTLVKGLNEKTKAEYSLPIAMINSGDLNFSFSGLKTSFSRLLKELTASEKHSLSKQQILDLSVMFEAAALGQLTMKLEKAIKKYSPKEIWLGGGVIASARLRSEMRNLCKKYNIQARFPFGKKLTTDNAAMIGVAANILIESLGGKNFVSQKLKAESHLLEKDGIYITNFEKIDREPSLSL